MRLGLVRIAGFTGISGEVELDLSADVTVLVAANGFGKSTVCDAIAWAFTGEHPRGVDPRSLYSSTGETHVEVNLLAVDGERVAVRRTLISQDPSKDGRIPSQLVIEASEALIRGPQAEIYLTNQLLPPTSANSDAAAKTLVDGYYLQQESLREFLSSRSDDQRFSALSQMVGAGALSEVVHSFESSRSAWTRALKDLELSVSSANARADDLRVLRDQLILELREDEELELGARASEFLTRASDLFGVENSLRAAEDQIAAIRLASSGLRSEAVRLAQYEEQVQAAVADIQIEIPIRPSGSAGEAELGVARALLAGSEAEYSRAIEEADAARAEAERAAAERQELASLAELALRHVGTSCPTCGQGVDPDELSTRLRGIIDRAADSAHSRRLTNAMNESDARLRDLERARQAYAQRELEARAFKDLESAFLAGQERLRSREERLSELVGREDGSRSLLDRASAALDDTRARRRAVEAMVNEASFLLTRIGVSEVSNRLAVVDSELESAMRERDELATLTTRHRATSTVADILLKALRSDAEGFVNDRLRDIRPTLEHFYAAIDPHPTFRNVQLVTRNWYGKNRLDAVAVDDSAGVRMTDPGRALSTSQANAMAVAVFLAFNLGLSPTRLDTIVLDDPLQNLDDVHLLGMIDLLRRLSSQRQMLITTHDRAYAGLLARKLRPLGEGGSASLISIIKWDRFGPKFVSEEIERDVSPLKIAVGE